MFTASLESGSAFDLVVLEERPGFILFKATGKQATQLFASEGGSHTWQRVPPTERRGRVHTSSITVAVLPEPKKSDFHISERDLEYKTTKSGGPGGQHVNKTESAVVLTHKPSGISVRVESRSQFANKETALEILRARLCAQHEESVRNQRNSERRQQIENTGTRTVREQDGTVQNHINGKKISYKLYRKGYLRDLL